MDMEAITLIGKGPDLEEKAVECKMSTEYKDKVSHLFKMWVGNTSGAPMMSATIKRKK